MNIHFPKEFLTLQNDLPQSFFNCELLSPEYSKFNQLFSNTTIKREEREVQVVMTKLVLPAWAAVGRALLVLKCSLLRTAVISAASWCWIYCKSTLQSYRT